MSRLAAPPPASPPSERAVLGSMLRDPFAASEGTRLLSEADFYVDANRRVFGAVLALLRAGRPADLVTVAEELHRRGDVEALGSYGYLGDLWEAAPVAANVAHYAATVRDRSVRRQLAYAAGEIAAEAQAGNGPAQELLHQAEQKIFGIAQAGTVGEAVSLGELVDPALERLEKRIKARRQRGDALPEGAIATGLPDLDQMLGGLQPSELTVIGARPSTGKTALGLAISRGALDHGHAVFFVSLEQSSGELVDRLVVAHTRTDSHKYRMGVLSDREFEDIAGARFTLRDLPLFIDARPAQTMLQIMANARRLKHRHGIKLVVVDYLQLVEPLNRREPRQEQVAGIARHLKQLARELECPVLSLAQLNRSSEDRPGGRPRLADLRESGGIEQDSDMVVLLHRPDATTDIVEALVEKNRNGPTGPVTLVFRKEFMRFESYGGEAPSF